VSDDAGISRQRSLDAQDALWNTLEGTDHPGGRAINDSRLDDDDDEDVGNIDGSDVSLSVRTNSKPRNSDLGALPG